MWMMPLHLHVNQKSDYIYIYNNIRKLKCSVQSNVLPNNCKQNITPLSLLAGTTVPVSHWGGGYQIFYQEIACVTNIFIILPLWCVNDTILKGIYFLWSKMVPLANRFHKPISEYHWFHFYTKKYMSQNPCTGPHLGLGMSKPGFVVCEQQRISAFVICIVESIIS